MNTRNLTCTYLFPDGHAVQVFEKHDPDAGLVQFVEVHERFTAARLDFTGRIIFGRHNGGLADVVRRLATGIRATAPSVDQGSEATRKAGIYLGTLTVETKGGAIYFHEFPALLSGEYTYQPGATYAEKFNPDMSSWADHRVAKVHRIPVAVAKGQS